MQDELRSTKCIGHGNSLEAHGFHELRNIHDSRAQCSLDILNGTGQLGAGDADRC